MGLDHNSFLDGNYMCVKIEKLRVTVTYEYNFDQNRINIILRQN